MKIFKIITANVLILVAIVTLTSSNQINSVKSESALAIGYCPGPSDVRLYDENGNYWPRVIPNKQFIVWARGGTNSMSACIVAGAGYSLVGSACQDIGYNNFYPIAVIQTASSLTSAGITVQINNTCTSGNGTQTSFWQFRF